MRKIIFTLLLSFTFIGFSQTTAIPDENFEQALIDLGYDTAPIDGQVLTANIEGVTSLDVRNKNIADLTGIEGFTALITLLCSNNNLTSLDVSNNIALTRLFCISNQLTSLDVSNNIALTDLRCIDNQLTSLDVSVNPALTILFCGINQLTSLDVSQNTALTQLKCIENQLTSLDVSNNTALSILDVGNNQLTGSLNLSNNFLLGELQCQSNKIEILNIKNGNNTNVTNFNASTNPDLYCIVVDNIDYSTTNWTNRDPASTFVNNETDCDALSLVDNDFELEVTIYPNPTDNYLFIEGNVNPVSIIIYNLLGAKVIAKSNTDKIDVSELSKGVYIINISDDVSQTNKKFIKN